MLQHYQHAASEVRRLCSPGRMAFAVHRVHVMRSLYAGDPDSVMDMLPLRMPSASENAHVFNEWRTPFWGTRVVIGDELSPRGWLYEPRVPMRWEDDSAIRSLVASLDAQLVMNLRRLSLPQPRPPLPPNKKRAAKRAKRAEHKARTQERRASQRRMR